MRDVISEEMVNKIIENCNFRNENVRIVIKTSKAALKTKRKFNLVKEDKFNLVKEIN